MASVTPNPTAIPTVKVSARTEQQQMPREHTGINGTEAALVGAVLTAIIAALGWIAVHYLTLKREREARAHADLRNRESKKIELLSILRLWEQRFVIHRDPVEIAKLYYSGGGMSEIASATEKLRYYVKDKETFDRLNVIRGMSQQTLNARRV